MSFVTQELQTMETSNHMLGVKKHLGTKEGLIRNPDPKLMK